MKPPIELDKPGAGLPGKRLAVARPLFRLASARLPRRRLERVYGKERERLLARTDGLSPETITKQVLVPRLFGLEDSSRFWSPAMILQHCTIVDYGLTDIILKLQAQEVIEKEVRIEDVKPKDDADERDRTLFKRQTTQSTRKLATVDRLSTTSTHDHPWFGPLTARQWFALRALHLRIHRRQLEVVLASPLA